jgi:hypothetical protein
MSLLGRNMSYICPMSENVKCLVLRVCFVIVCLSESDLVES